MAFIDLNAPLIEAELKLRKLDVKRETGTEESWVYTLHLESEVDAGEEHELDRLIPGSCAIIEAGFDSADPDDEGNDPPKSKLVQASLKVKGESEHYNAVIESDGVVICKGKLTLLGGEVKVQGKKALLTQRVRLYSPEPGISQVGLLFQRLHREVKVELESAQMPLTFPAKAEA